MRRTLAWATVLLMVFASAAYAGRGRGGKGRGHKSGGVVVRDHRGGGPARHRGPAVRDHRGPRHHHGPRGKHVRVSRGRYVFPGGVVRVYKRPVIRTHYYNARVRPPLIIEAYDPVPGYMWVAGAWTWGGSEWVWAPGYWAVADAPPVNGGFTISGGITIR